MLVEKKLLLLQSIISKEIKNNKLYFYLKIIFPASLPLVIYGGFANLLFKSAHNWHDLPLVFDMLGTAAILYIMFSMLIIYFFDFIDLLISSKKKKFVKSIDWILLELDIHKNG